jgi:hypothetical protein
MFDASVLYASRPAWSEAAAAFIAIDIEVFLTSGSLFSAWGTTSLVVSVGDVGAFEGSEEESDFVLSAVSAGLGGWLMGRLEVDLTIRGRSCDEPVELKAKVTNSAQTKRYEIFFKLFKTYTPKFFS